MAAGNWGFNGEVMVSFVLDDSLIESNQIKLVFVPTAAAAPDEEPVVSTDESASTVPLARSTSQSESVLSPAGELFSIEEVRTYWTTERASGGGNLLVPEVRFMVRVHGNEPLGFLQLMAVFIETVDGGLEQLGDGSSFVVGSTDPPLRPGIRKETWLTSTRGYRDSGMTGVRFLTGNAPDMEAEMYYRTAIFDDWIYFGVLEVDKSLE